MFGVAGRSIVSLNKWITDRSDFLVCCGFAQKNANADLLAVGAVYDVYDRAYSRSRVLLVSGPLSRIAIVEILISVFSWKSSLAASTTSEVKTRRIRRSAY